MDPLLRLLASFTGPEPEPSDLTEEMRIREKVKSLLDWLTRWNFEKVKDQLVQTISGAISSSVLQFLVSCIFDMAIEEDAFVLFGHLCAELCSELPHIQSDELVWKDISFKRLLLNKCQMEFDNATMETDRFLVVRDDDKLRVKLVGTVQFVAELFNSKLVTERICHHIIQKLISCPRGRNLQALCYFLRSIGKKVDSNSKSRQLLELYFVKLGEIVQSPDLTPCSRVMILDLQYLRANNWVEKDRSTTAGAEKKQEICYGSTSTTSHTRDLGSLPARGAAEDNNIPETLEKALKEIRTLKLDVQLLRVEAEKHANFSAHLAEVLNRKYQSEAIERREMRLLLETLRKERDDALEITQHLLEGERSDEHKAPPSFFCPITQEVMEDPQVAADGFTYEAEAIRKWIGSGHNTSPITNLKLPHLSLLPNRALRSAIRECQKQP